MAKRYNIIVVEQDDKPIMDPLFGPKKVYEEELVIKRMDGVIYIDNLIHTMFVAIEDAIEENEA